METSARRFADALSQALVQGLGWTYVSSESWAPAPLRVVAGERGALAVFDGEPRAAREIGDLVKAWHAKLKARELPPNWGVVGLLFVFDTGCGVEYQEAIAGCSNTEAVSTGAVCVGWADLFDGASAMKADDRLPIAPTLSRTVSQWMEDEGRVDEALDRREPVAGAEAPPARPDTDAEAEELDELLASIAAPRWTSRPWFTWAIALLSVGLFAWMESAGGSTRVVTLLRFGAINWALLREGEWGRLFSAAFLHIGSIHLVVNMVGLLSVGPPMERYFGNARFLALCCVTTVVGAGVSAVADARCTAGSGAIILGACGAALWTGYRYGASLSPAHRSWMTRGMLFWVAVNILLWVFYAGCDWRGPLGGLLAGAAFAAIVPPPNLFPKPRDARPGAAWKAFLALGLLLFAVEGHALWRAATPGENSLGPLVAYRDPEGRFEMRVPSLLTRQMDAESTLFQCPGFGLVVSLVPSYREIDIETQRDEILADYQEQGKRVQASSVEKVSGRTWLVIDLVEGKDTLHRTAIAPHGRFLYRIDIASDREDFAYAKAVLAGILESFRPLVGE